VVSEHENDLTVHLMHDHVMTPDQARQEAHEASHGIRRDDRGRCTYCHRTGDHQQSCAAMKRAARWGYPPEKFPPKGPVQIVVDGMAYTPPTIREGIAFLEELAFLEPDL
jgi:hypothetical protein